MMRDALIVILGLLNLLAIGTVIGLLVALTKRIRARFGVRTAFIFVLLLLICPDSLPERTGSKPKAAPETAPYTGRPTRLETTTLAVTPLFRIKLDLRYRTDQKDALPVGIVSATVVQLGLLLGVHWQTDAVTASLIRQRTVAHYCIGGKYRYTLLGYQLFEEKVCFEGHTTGARPQATYSGLPMSRDRPSGRYCCLQNGY